MMKCQHWQLLSVLGKRPIVVVYNHWSALSVWDPAFSQSWFKPWKNVEDLIPHRQCQEDLGLTLGSCWLTWCFAHLHSFSPQVLEDPSLMLEDFAPPEQDISTSRELLILTKQNGFLSAGLLPLFWGNSTESLLCPSARMPLISVSSLQKALLNRFKDNKIWLDVNQHFYEMFCVLWLFFFSLQFSPEHHHDSTLLTSKRSAWRATCMCNMEEKK